MKVLYHYKKIYKLHFGNKNSNAKKGQTKLVERQKVLEKNMGLERY